MHLLAFLKLVLIHLLHVDMKINITLLTCGVCMYVCMYVSMCVCGGGGGVKDYLLTIIITKPTRQVFIS